jgi:hypothetical protein
MAQASPGSEREQLLIFRAVSIITLAAVPGSGLRSITRLLPISIEHQDIAATLVYLRVQDVAPFR